MTLLKNKVWNALFVQVLLPVRMPTVSRHRLVYVYVVYVYSVNKITFLGNPVHLPFGGVGVVCVTQPPSLVLPTSLFKVPSVISLSYNASGIYQKVV